jgi:molecular chaperone HscC
MIDDHAAVGDLVVTDVASHSLGVSSSREIGERYVPGFFVPIIHRNTVIPTSQWEGFSTIHDGQTEVRFDVYEGEARRVEENRKIGSLTVKVPRGKAPKAVKVQFTYDQNGMLEVEALVIETGERVAHVFHRSGRSVEGAELAEAQRRLTSLRADPLDRPRYRDAKARAQLLWKEATLDERRALDERIDALDHAAESRNPAELERCYAALVALCRELDHDERN